MSRVLTGDAFNNVLLSLHDLVYQGGLEWPTGKPKGDAFIWCWCCHWPCHWKTKIVNNTRVLFLLYCSVQVGVCIAYLLIGIVVSSVFWTRRRRPSTRSGQSQVVETTASQMWCFMQYLGALEAYLWAIGPLPRIQPPCNPVLNTLFVSRLCFSTNL